MSHDTLTHHEVMPAFASRLRAITERQLTGADQLSTYAETALKDLIDLIDDAIADFKPTNESGIVLEHAALRASGVSPDALESVIKWLVAKDREIRTILNAEVQRSSTVFVPPRTTEATLITPGSESFRGLELSPRAATIKFVLANLSGEPYEMLERSGRITAVLGEVNPTMMRQTPYEMITSADFNRTILVCDETGNRTFVFDTKMLQGLGVDEAVIKLDKGELDMLLSEHVGIGRAFVYEPRSFVSTFMTTLESLDTEQPKTTPERTSELLLPPATDEVISATQICAILNDLYGTNLSHKGIYAIADVLEEEGLISGQRYRIGPMKVMRGFDSHEFEVIHERLGDRDMLYPRAEPGDVNYPNKVAHLLGVSAETVFKIGDLLSVDIRSMPMKRLANGSVWPICDQDTLQRFRDYLAQNPAPALPETRKRGVEAAPRRLARENLIDTIGSIAGRYAIQGIMRDLGIDRTRLTSADTETIESIRQEAERRGFARPPEGYMGVDLISSVYGFERHEIRRAAEDLKDDIGYVVKHVYDQKRAYSYSPEQVRILVEYLNGKHEARAPEIDDRLTTGMVARALDIDKQFARKLLKEFDDEIRFNNNRNVPTYDSSVLDTLQQDRRVREYLTARPHPAGVEAKSTFAKRWHVSPLTIDKFAHKYHMPLGVFKYGFRIEDGYFDHDRSYLHQILEDNHYFSPELGTDEYTMNTAAREVGLRDGMTVKKIVTILRMQDESFGDLLIRRTNNNIADALDSRQLELVRRYVDENELRRGPMK